MYLLGQRYLASVTELNEGHSGPQGESRILRGSGKKLAHFEGVYGVRGEGRKSGAHKPGKD